MKSIGIDNATHEDLKRFCSEHGITQGEFVRIALDYFQKTGINPTDKPVSIGELLAKIQIYLSAIYEHGAARGRFGRSIKEANQRFNLL
jgi:hypothetical protein